MKTMKLGNVEYRVAREGTDKLTGESVYLLEHPETKALECFYRDEGVLFSADGMRFE